MSHVLPFPALRYNPQLAPDLARVVCPPYDVIGPAEQGQLQAASPYNAVHLELPVDAPGEPGSRYRLAAERLGRWRDAGVLRPDPRPGLYLHETRFTFGGRAYRRRDLLAAVAVGPWSAGTPLPHEQTMARPKADRLELLRATRANLSPIWVLHREEPRALAEAWAAAEARPPAAQFSLASEDHRLWVVDDAAAVEAIGRAFAEGGPLYIADGHHRYETAVAFRQEAAAELPDASATLAALTWAGDPGLLALPTHRLVRSLDPGLTLEEVETRWSDVFHAEYFHVWEGAPAEQVEAFMRQLASAGQAAPTFGLLGPGQADVFGLLALRGRAPPAGALPASRSAAWKALDVALLHALLVDPLVAETGRPREEVLGYTRDAHEAFAAVREGRASAALFLNPTPVEQVLAVADAGDRMPEKSTYFYPKPPTGLVIRALGAGAWRPPPGRTA